MVTLHQIVCLAAVLCAVGLIGSDAQRDKHGANNEQVACDGTKTGVWWQDEAEPCSKEYQVCRSFAYRNHRCVLGHFNYTTGYCQRFQDGGPCNIDDRAEYGLDRKKRDVSEVADLHRTKRQATDCSTSPKYDCPANVNQLVVFPDFDQASCSHFNLCLNGQLTTIPCSNAGYVFYNPRLVSCEEYPALSNTCVWRTWADYTPFNGSI